MAAVLGRLIFTLLPGGFDVADVHQPGQRRRPQPRQRTAAGVERQVVAGALVEPARAHNPTVVAVEVALLRLGDRGLVPGVPLVDRVAERIVRDEGLFVFPILVVRAAQQDADAEVDVDQVGRHQLAVDDDAGGDEHRLAPLAHVLVLVVADVRVLERAPAAQQNAPPADLLVARQGLIEEVEDVVVHRHDLLDEVHVRASAGRDSR